MRKHNVVSADRPRTVPGAPNPFVANPNPDKVRTFSISVTVLAKDAERIGAEIEGFMDKQCEATPGYCGSFSFKDEEV